MKRNFSAFETQTNMDGNITKKVALVERDPVPSGIALVNPRKVAKKAPNDLVELAMEIQNSNNFVHATACSKLGIIADQVRFLHEQAQQVLLETKTNLELHEIACNFKKIPGNTYYLYVRPSGQKYFSMLSPEEWANHPHEFIGGYRLEADHSWTPENEILNRDSQNIMIHKLLTSKTNRPSITFGIEESPMELN